MLNHWSEPPQKLTLFTLYLQTRITVAMGPLCPRSITPINKPQQDIRAKRRRRDKEELVSRDLAFRNPRETENRASNPQAGSDLWDEEAMSNKATSVHSESAFETTGSALCTNRIEHACQANATCQQRIQLPLWTTDDVTSFKLSVDICL